MLLKTKRLQLRPIQDIDIRPVFKIGSNNTHMEYYNSYTFYNIHDAEKFLVHKLNKSTERTWVITFDNAPVGWISVNYPLKQVGVLAYILSPDHTGKGYMTEALSSVLDSCFLLGTKSIEARVVKMNEPSCKLLERLGFIMLHEDLQYFRERRRRTCGYMITRNMWVRQRLRQIKDGVLRYLKAQIGFSC